MKINGKPDGGGGGGVITGLSVSANGTYTATGGVDGYSPVNVSVPERIPVTESLSVSINGTYTPETGVDGFSQVDVSVIPPLQSKSITVNGLVTPDEGYYGLSAVDVSVPEQKPEETFSVTPSIAEQTVTPQEGYVFSGGTVAAVTSTIDGNIQAGNIKSGVTILGVEGTYTAPAPVTESLSVSINGTYTPGTGVDGFSQVVVDVPQSAAGFTEKEITEGVSVSVINNDASFVRDYAFYSNKTIKEVNLPYVYLIGNNAFQYCSFISTISVPGCYSIGGSVFGNCISLQSLTIGLYNYVIPYYNNALANTSSFLTTGKIYVNEENYNSWITSNGWNSLSSLFVSVHISEPILSFSNGLVYGCTYYISSNYATYLGIDKTNVTELNLPSVKLINQSTFSSNVNISYADLPECYIIGSRAFTDCNVLTSVNLPKCKILYDYAFYDCDILSTISLPECESIYYGAFTWCSTLKTINLPKCNYIDSDVFNRCGKAQELTLGNSTVCVLGGPLGGSFNASIYVPSSLVEAYKTATNWSDYSNRIFPITE